MSFTSTSSNQGSFNLFPRSGPLPPSFSPSGNWVHRLPFKARAPTDIVLLNLTSIRIWERQVKEWFGGRGAGGFRLKNPWIGYLTRNPCIGSVAFLICLSHTLGKTSLLVRSLNFFPFSAPGI